MFHQIFHNFREFSQKAEPSDDDFKVLLWKNLGSNGTPPRGPSRGYFNVNVANFSTFLSQNYINLEKIGFGLAPSHP